MGLRKNLSGHASTADYEQAVTAKESFNVEAYGLTSTFALHQNVSRLKHGTRVSLPHFALDVTEMRVHAVSAKE